ncbi:MAG: class I SAM-dependent methyltransferase [Crocosphaera sp.]|nr:class I SAM-dependent methyltransferase [Crocosphaera sp.]
MSLFQEIIKPYSGMKVLDVGGTPSIWDYIETPLQITCLNLPSPKPQPKYESHHSIKLVDGDGCNMQEFNSGDFDLIFSNSVIEHVGDIDKQEQFAKEILRLSGKSGNYWVQTPCKVFPIEAHTGMLFWWYYPDSVRKYFISRWSQKLPAWTEMVKHTTIIHKETLESLFPNGSMITEWFVLPKSLIVYRRE